MKEIRDLPRPGDLKKDLPLSPASVCLRRSKIREMKEILSGRNDRLLVIIGPCSADRKGPVMDYIKRLGRLQKEVSEQILLVPRVYVEKPRTRGTGYKGMVEFPDPLKGPDLSRGLFASRDLLREVLEEGSFAPALELVYPDHYAYFDDLMAYLTIGARSVESPAIRMLASGMDIPVGVKNPTSGDLSVSIASLLSIQMAQRFPYRGKEWASSGNPYAHLILRGYSDRTGRPRPNFGPEFLEEVRDRFKESEAINPAVLVDANHSNSGKDPDRQVDIIRTLMDLRFRLPWVKTLVKGFMMESYLLDGAQAEDGIVEGKSITDPCLGWEKTRTLLLDLGQGGRR